MHRTDDDAQTADDLDAEIVAVAATLDDDDLDSVLAFARQKAEAHAAERTAETHTP